MLKVTLGILSVGLTACAANPAPNERVDELGVSRQSECKDSIATLDAKGRRAVVAKGQSWKRFMGERQSTFSVEDGDIVMLLYPAPLSDEPIIRITFKGAACKIVEIVLEQ